MGHMCCAARFHPLYKMGRRMPKGTVRHFHVLETLATFQSSRHAGPSSLQSVLLLVRVDTPAEALYCSALRQSWLVGLDRIVGLYCIDALHQ